jgi:hypothetical protein
VCARVRGRGGAGNGSGSRRLFAAFLFERCGKSCEAPGVGKRGSTGDGAAHLSFTNAIRVVHGCVYRPIRFFGTNIGATGRTRPLPARGFGPGAFILQPSERRFGAPGSAPKGVDRRPRASGRSYRAYESRPARVVNPARRPHRVGAYRVALGRPFPDGGCIAGVPPAFHVGRVLFLEGIFTRGGSYPNARRFVSHGTSRSRASPAIGPTVHVPGLTARSYVTRPTRSPR